MTMHPDRQAAIIVNDLASLILRIEALPGHSAYTEAQQLVQAARNAVEMGRADLHTQDMRRRFAEMDAA